MKTEAPHTEGTAPTPALLDGLEDGPPLVAATPAAVTVELVPAGYIDMGRAQGELLHHGDVPVVVRSQQEADYLNARRLAVLALIKEHKPAFDATCATAKQAHTQACALREKHIGPLEQHERALAQLITAWQGQQKRLADEAARVERDRLLADERARVEAEAKARAKAGDKAGAQQIRDMPITVPAVAMRPAPPKPQGLSTRTDWKWRPVTGESEADVAMAIKVVPREYLTLNAKALDAAATLHKGTLRVPGIEFYSVDVPVRR